MITGSLNGGERLYVAVDVGGTFTDVCVVDHATGEVSVMKVPSRVRSPERPVIEGLAAAGVEGAHIRLFRHGTTVATNALITRDFPRAGLVATKGFRDVLEIRRSTKPHLWDAYVDVTPPYIRRRDRLEVEERVAYDGSVVTPLNEEDARAVARILRRRRVEAVAVCFMNAFRNGVHERMMAEILREEMPDVVISVSSDVLPEIFEPERVSTTVINAILGPVVKKYMHRMSRELRKLGYEREVLVLHSGGGVLTAETAGEYSARIAASGPAAGGVAMAEIAKHAGFPNAIGLDMGGTSSDISLMWNGELRMTKEWHVEYGYPIRFPSLDLVTIGAGGGSIARVDEGGSLRVGPQSAGAEPGPASYERGGTEPTVTDANLVHGRLLPDLLGGRMQLTPAAAATAIDSRVAEPLGLGVIEAADAILRVANANMCDAIRLLSIQKGYDPRDFALVAFGGAGPLHGVEVAREVGIPYVIVPPHPGITSAIGCLLVDIQHDLSKTLTLPAIPDSERELRREFDALEEEAVARLRKDGIPGEQIQLLHYVEMCYVGQWRHLAVRIDQGLGNLSMLDLLDGFHREHQREFSYSRPDQPVEVSGIRLTARGRLPKPTLPTYTGKRGAPSGARGETHYVHFSADGEPVETPVLDRADLQAGATVTGPAIVVEFDSTTLIPPDLAATVDRYHNIVIATAGVTA